MLIGVKSSGNADDQEYIQFLSRLQERVDSFSGGHFFTTDAKYLWERWLECFPVNQRQYQTCSACEKFIRKYGSLVIINEMGEVAPVIWDANIFPEEDYRAALEMEMAIHDCSVNGVFCADEDHWGNPGCGTWLHLNVRGPKLKKNFLGFKTAHEVMAEKREEFRIVKRALVEFTDKQAKKAHTLLKSGAFYRPEKVVKQAGWFESLYGKNDNQIWREVADAPAGFCHPRSSMLGTLLEDLKNGLKVETIKRKFGAKMDPLKYQRPKAAPKDGQIDRAEKIVEQMGLRKAFDRRFARKDELLNMWEPQNEPEEQPKEMFGHLRKGANLDDSPVSAGKVSWLYFQTQVLPEAKQIKINVVNTSMNWGAICTAVHDDAPPILQWDNEEQRNPFSWYVWNGGSRFYNVGLDSAGWYDLSSICKKPCGWYQDFGHHGEGYFLVVGEAREQRQAGNGLFPECLKSELREVRSVIEAHSRMSEIQGVRDEHAMGVVVDKDSIGVSLRALVDGQWFEYKIASFQ